MGKNSRSGSGMFISSQKQFFGVKILKFFNAYADADPGCKKIRIRDKHHKSATQKTGTGYRYGTSLNLFS
jgi:hypothetical protein